MHAHPSSRRTDRKPTVTAAARRTQIVEAAIAGILRRGQETGDFRACDVGVMATTIQRSLDGIPFLPMTTPDLDLAHYGAELVETFTRATANSPAQPS